MSDSQNISLFGGAFLIQNDAASHTFTPEDFTEEQKMIEQMCQELLEKEVFPKLNNIDRQEPGLMESILNKTGELGLLGAAFPEHLGGLGEDFVTATLINEGLGAGHSVAVAVAAHNGIGSLPILYFGTDRQKEKYMPKLATGEMKGAYALTEPNSGSDALSAKTTATLTDDGQFYLLNGQKCWITNAGFADVFTVFAKIDGEKFTAFIVEKGTPGFTLGEEEHKMGIKGSSTRMIFFENAQVPIENVLGEIGKGHLIAFNILNIGRLKLCAAALGGAKRALNISADYAKTREQFGQPIAHFGAIKHKLGEMFIKAFVTESALYRTTKWINDKEKELTANGKAGNEALLGAAEEFAIECAMLKVIGSETLDYIVDEGVQIHGGNGFSDEYDISRSYRDSRINRIFEGTNEINRLLILDMYLKRALKGRIDLMGAATKVQTELTSIPSLNVEPLGETDDPTYWTIRKQVEQFKKAVLICAGAAVQKLMTRLEDEQEILMNLSDMAMETFMAESVLLRAEKLHLNKTATADLAKTIAQIYIHDAADKIGTAGKNAIHAFAEGDDLRLLLLGLKRFTKTEPFNAKTARRQVADHVLEK